MLTEHREQKLAGQYGYPVAPMNPPPAEKSPNVVQFSLTQGCSHGRCTFCTMYRRDGQEFKMKSLPEFKSHVDQVLAYLKKHPGELRQIDRIFLGAGNALHADVDLLLQASQYALKAVKLAVPGNPIPRRLAVYGNTKDILEKDRDMRLLRCGGTCGWMGGKCSIDSLGEKRGVDVVYWGIESGSDKVLKIAGKGYTQDQAAQAGQILQSADVRPSVMIMPGLGGIAHSEDHVYDTAMLLNYVRPEWTTFIGLKINDGTPYAKWMEREEAENRNRRMTPAEMAEQTARIVELLNFPTSVGVHGDQVHTFGHNPVTIGVAKIEDGYGARRVARQIRQTASGEFGEGTKAFRMLDIESLLNRFTPNKLT